MTLWRPPTTRGERAMRAIRSMQSGSIDGRVVSAYPVKPDVVEEEDYDIYSDLDEAEEVTAGDDDSIKPWTDYFPINAVNTVYTFALTKTPWVQEKMQNETKSYSSVHVYWNGVFQRDLSYSLESAVVTIVDSDLRFRVGDTVTVKYFYDQETSGAIDPNMYRMQCWFNSHDIVSPDRPGYNIFWAGVLEASPTGSNTGTITTTAGRYYTAQVTGGWGSKFRGVPGQKIPVGDDVAGVTWRISYDTGADVSIDTEGSDNFFVRGTDYGTIVCHKTCCGFEVGGDGCACGSEQLPLLRYDVTQGPFNPSFGPIGGTVFESGQAGLRLAQYINYRNSGDPNATSGVFVSRQMPKYPDPIPYNSGCTYAGGIANAEDTIYGKHSHEKATYNVKIGVTATVVMK